MFSYNSIAIVSKNIFDTQILPTTPQPTPVPLKIITLSNERLDNKA